MLHPLKQMIEKRRKGINVGIPSYCTANELILETVLERAKEKNTVVLIEATANQVNQFGGYTGMKPRDFMECVKKIAEHVGCPQELVIMAGDHLGPLTWKDEPAREAMEKAKELVCQYVLAGFTKIHLDTSMKLGGDDENLPLSTRIIAKRGVQLYQACMEAYTTLQQHKPNALRPVFVIGSEVPIPGGSQDEEEHIHVTQTTDFVNTVQTYQCVFSEYGFENAWDDIIAVVTQPGVEFGDAQVCMYNRDKAKNLCDKLKEYPNIVFEGHSTDYQSRESLKRMVEDGIAILKVGPALTFALREALFALSMIEKELVPKEAQAGFMEVLDETMCAEPKNWKKHYHGDEATLAFARKYSFSDRCRYYIGEERVSEAIERLFENLNKIKIPMNILHQYMPIQYAEIQEGEMLLEARSLAKAGVISCIQNYEYAVCE